MSYCQHLTISYNTTNVHKVGYCTKAVCTYKFWEIKKIIIDDRYKKTNVELIIDFADYGANCKIVSHLPILLKIV